jgi:hypothetical protein
MARTPRVRRKKRRLRGSRQRAAVDLVAVRSCAVVETEVTVLMVATELCAVPLVRVMLDGSSEHVAYWPGLMGVQFRTTVPV